MDSCGICVHTFDGFISNKFVRSLKMPLLFLSSKIIDSPCETAGLEQLRVRGILELPGVSDESSQCLLFILLDVVVVVLLPQFEVVDDALLLSIGRKTERKLVIRHRAKSLKGRVD
jgi:hypothetical protein